MAATKRKRPPLRLHSGGRIRPAEPTIDFEVMNDRLMKRFQKHCENHAVNIGLGGDIDRKTIGRLKDASYQPRFRGKAGLVRDIADVRKVILDKWNGIHPLKAADALISTKKTTKKGANIGIISFRRAKRRVAGARQLREKYAPAFNQVYEQYKQETLQALSELMDTFESGKINWDNYNWHMERYEEAIKKAEYNFVRDREKLMDAHNKEWKNVA